MQRRDFIRDLAVGAVALAVTPTCRWLSRPGMPAVGREGWSGAAFAHVKDTSFVVAGPDGAQKLTLDQVIHQRSGGLETASLRFRGEAARQLAEGSYDFSHADLGRMSILVIPGTKSGSSCSYRAIFTRFA
jgi:hypothetical protein